MNKQSIFIMFIILISVVVFVIDLMLPLGVAGGVPYVIIVLLALWIPQRKYTIIAAIVGTVLTILGYSFSSYISGEHEEMVWMVLVNRFLALFVIWVTAILTLERKQAEEQIKASLREKEVLLSEIHHRVKNNMQVVSSLLKIQSDKIKDKQYADMFKESNDRIRSMALIHEKLYQSEDFANVDFKGYVKSLVNSLFRSYGIDTNKIALKIEVEGVSLGTKTTIPCALLINELVSNSLKYAFPEEREGEIRIALRSINEDELELIISDNGIGIPEDLDIKNTKSLGLDLVMILAEDQLEGKVELNRTDGTKYIIHIKRQT